MAKNTYRHDPAPEPQVVIRYFFHDLITGAYKGTLPLRNVNVADALASTEQLTGALNIGDDRVQKLNPVDLTEPKRRALHVVVNDPDTGYPHVVWSGIVGSRTYDSTTSEISITADQYIDYWGHRPFEHSLGVVGMDEFEAVAAIMEHVMAEPGARIQIDLSRVGLRGSTLGHEVFSWWDGNYALDALNALQQERSFEFRIAARWENALIVPYLVIAPTLGRKFGVGSPVLSFPGNVAKYTWNEDYSGFAVGELETGDGDGEATLRAVVLDETLLAAGYPRYMNQQSQSGFRNQAHLNRQALADLAQDSKTSATPPTLTTTISNRPKFGTYGLGDEVGIQIKDSRFNSPALNIIQRLTRWELDGETGELTWTVSQTVPYQVR